MCWCAVEKLLTHSPLVSGTVYCLLWMNLCWPSFITLDSFCYTLFTLSRLRPQLQSWCETRSYRGDLNSCAYNRQGHNKIRKICIHVLEIHQFGENLSATALRCSRHVLLSLLAVHMPCILHIWQTKYARVILPNLSIATAVFRQRNASITGRRFWCLILQCSTLCFKLQSLFSSFTAQLPA